MVKLKGIKKRKNIQKKKNSIDTEIGNLNLYSDMTKSSLYFLFYVL